MIERGREGEREGRGKREEGKREKKVSKFKRLRLGKIVALVDICEFANY